MPPSGLVLEVIDTDGPEARAALLEWLRSRHLPRRLAGSPSALVTVFRPTPLPGDRMPYVKQVEGVDTRLTLLWFLEADPRRAWMGVPPVRAKPRTGEHFTDLAAEVAAAGLGRVELVAPFIPTIPGTDRYVAELR